MTDQVTYCDIKWSTRQRLQYIEIMAWYTGVVSRSDLTRTFRLSPPAATKNLKLYSELVPGNLIYQQNLFGFVPSDNFVHMFADLSPATILPMLADNRAITSHPYNKSPTYGIPAVELPLPARYPSKEILAQLIRAIRHRRQVQVQYYSLSGNTVPRIIEPHSLVNNGLRWHIRAYNNQDFDFRDFVLARFSDAQMLTEEAESDALYDEDWNDTINIMLAPHPQLSEQKRQNLLLDYPMTDGFIEISTRRTLAGYLLKRLSVDTTDDHHLDADSYPLIVANREAIRLYCGWAFRN